MSVLPENDKLESNRTHIPPAAGNFYPLAVNTVTLPPKDPLGDVKTGGVYGNVSSMPRKRAYRRPQAVRLRPNDSALNRGAKFGLAA